MWHTNLCRPGAFMLAPIVTCYAQSRSVFHDLWQRPWVSSISTSLLFRSCCWACAGRLHHPVRPFLSRSSLSFRTAPLIHNPEPCAHIPVVPGLESAPDVGLRSREPGQLVVIKLGHALPTAPSSELSASLSLPPSLPLLLIWFHGQTQAEFPLPGLGWVVLGRRVRLRLDGWGCFSERFFSGWWWGWGLWWGVVRPGSHSFTPQIFLCANFHARQLGNVSNPFQFHTLIAHIIFTSQDMSL